MNAPLLSFGKLRFTYAGENTVWPFYAQFFQDAYGCLQINDGDTVLDALSEDFVSPCSSLRSRLRILFAASTSRVCLRGLSTRQGGLWRDPRRVLPSRRASGRRRASRRH